MAGPDRPADASASASGQVSSSGRWQRIQRLVDGALDLPPAQRAAYLSQACGADAALYESAARLLDACDEAARTGGFLDAPAAALVAPVLAELAAEALRAALAGRYDIERELGRGGMATVYLARDLRHDRPVAVKVLERGVAPAGAERFLREIRIAARLTHPHVLGVHDSGEADGLLWYVMPYVEGETLRTRLVREGALPAAEARRLLRELADALAHAHQRGVVHRDLKPENVLLSGGHAVVADFGIAKALAAATHGGTADATLTTVGTTLGTPAYMAPEQVAGDPGVDHRADLYALGVIAYEVLTGAHPFGTRPPRVLLAAHLTEAPAPLDSRGADVPPPLAALVMQLLAKDPATRPDGAGAVLRVLDTLPATPARSGRPRRRLALAGAALLLTTASVAGSVMWRERAATGDGHGAGAELAPAAVRTVAVLPFVNTGGDPADDYVSDGLTDELAHALARISGLRLAGRTSSYAFKGTVAPAQEIGRTLGVGALVTGTMRRAGERIRVTAQLVSTADGKVLRHAASESRSGDLFAVQDELTRTIVAALAPALGDHATDIAMGGAPRGTTDQEAYDLYLKGRYHWLERGAANIVRSISYYRAAVARDPAFARAHAGLALAYNVLPIYIPDPADTVTALAEASARRAVALDSTLAEAQVALGLALERRLRMPEAQARYRAALALEPSSVIAHHVLGMQLLSTGRTDEGLAELREATRLDPLAKSAATGVAFALAAGRRFPEARDASRQVLARDSTFPLAIMQLGLAQAFGGQPDSAVQTLERGHRLHPDAPGLRPLLVFAYAAAGRWADAERARAELRRPGGDQSGGVESALAEMVLGDPEPLVRLLATEEGQRRWTDTGGAFGCHPLLDPLWSDQRFRTAMRRIGVEPCGLARPWPIPPRAGS